jgi:molybdate transport repressor ModE-like protein
MHKAQVEFDATWLAGRGLPRERSRALLRLLAELERSSSLREAARAADVSYRFAWGALGDAARLFGEPLVAMRQGRGASLTPLGRKVLEVDRRVRDELGPQFERLRQEISLHLGRSAATAQARLTMHASHDLALTALPELCNPNLELALEFRGSDESLADLAQGKCELAGFHVADALPRAAAAAAALGKWLDPRRHTLIHFVTREQGLIVRPGSRIRGVHDLARPGVRFIHRPSGGGASAEESPIAAAVAGERADAGFGLRAEAARFKLSFVPLAVERYFIACTKASLRAPAMQFLLEVLASDAFAARVAELPGYDPGHAGRREGLDAALTWVGRTKAVART